MGVTGLMDEAVLSQVRGGINLQIVATVRKKAASAIRISVDNEFLHHDLAVE